MQEDEQLNPELEECIEEVDGWIGATLKHPLVFAVPYSKDMNRYLNRMFESKVKEVERAVKNRNWSQVMWLHERPCRPQAMSKFMWFMKADEYWKVLADIWIDTELPFHSQDTWVSLFTAPIKQKRKLMNSVDRRALQKFPNSIRIYRGYDDKKDQGLLGLSWTIDEKKAEWFGKRFGYDGTPAVAVGMCKKSDVLAYFSGRGEHEIVVDPRTVQIIENKILEITPEDLLTQYETKSIKDLE